MCNLVQVATAFSVSEAIIVQSMLRSYGIKANTFDLDTVNIDPGLMLAIGGIRICVHSSDAEVARDLIWTDQEEIIPPRPHSSNWAVNALAAITCMLMGAPSPARIPLQR
jgi:hypothetical protein